MRRSAPARQRSLDPADERPAAIPKLTQDEAVLRALELNILGKATGETEHAENSGTQRVVRGVTRHFPHFEGLVCLQSGSRLYG